jgi:hypothetical protein
MAARRIRSAVKVTCGDYYSSIRNYALADQDYRLGDATLDRC